MRASDRSFPLTSRKLRVLAVGFVVVQVDEQVMKVLGENEKSMTESLLHVYWLKTFPCLSVLDVTRVKELQQLSPISKRMLRISMDLICQILQNSIKQQSGLQASQTIAFILLMQRVVGFATNHKKKLIFIVIIPLLCYFIKRKLTMRTFFAILEKVSKLTLYLPLPTVLSYRPAAPYQHFNLRPLKEIIGAIGLESIRADIKAKRSSWNELKLSVLAGTSLAVTLYNVQTFYYLVQCKYLKDFEHLQAGQAFETLMRAVRDKFVQDIPLLHSMAKELLAFEAEKLVITKEYTTAEIIHALQSHCAKFFEKTYRISESIRQSSLNRTHIKESPQCKVASNHYLSAKEIPPPPSHSLMRKIVVSPISTLIDALSGEWLPAPIEEFTEMRYHCCRAFYQLSLKKVVVDIRWPNPQSELLGKLVFQEMGHTLESLNFHTLVFQNAQTRFGMLVNRIEIFLQSSQQKGLQLANWLPVIYKIISEQFLNEQAPDRRERFHQLEIKKALQAVMQNDCRGNLRMAERALKQVESYNAWEHTEKEFQLKYFNERSEVMLTVGASPRKDSDKMVQMLSSLGQNSIGRQND